MYIYHACRYMQQVTRIWITQQTSQQEGCVHWTQHGSYLWCYAKPQLFIFLLLLLLQLALVFLLQSTLLLFKVPLQLLLQLLLDTCLYLRQTRSRYSLQVHTLCICTYDTNTCIQLSVSIQYVRTPKALQKSTHMNTSICGLLMVERDGSAEK